MQPICHLNLAPGYRGGERQTELLIRELAERGLRQRLVARRGQDLARHCRGITGLEIREVASNPLAAGIAVRGCAAAHSHEGRTVYSGLLANLLFGIPYMFTRRIVAPQEASRVRSLAYRRASRVAAVSRAAAEEIAVRHPELSTVVVPDAHARFEIDKAEVEKIRAARPGKTLIGHIGAYDQSHKGQETIIAVARLAAEHFPDWQFMLCGEGKDEGRFRDSISEMDNIELVGWVENVGDYLSAFDLFVYPSLHEALGSTLLDAMYVGLPIVASRVGGIPDVIEDGVNGWLVPPEMPEQFLDAIQEVLENEGLRSAMREANVHKADLFGATAMADAYETLYREIST